MSLASRISDLAISIATRLKLVLTLINGNVLDLSALNTTAKNNLVAAINEVKAATDAAGGGASINDGVTGSGSTWSSTKISGEISGAVTALVDGAPGAIDTLNELAAALGDDPSFASSTAAALGNRVRTDTATQGLDATQQGNARTNIGAVAASDVGNTDTDFVETFTTGLL